MSDPHVHMDIPEDPQAPAETPRRRRIWTVLVAGTIAALVYASLRLCGGPPADSPPPPPSEATFAPHEHGHMGTDADRTAPATEEAITLIRGFATDFATPGSGAQDWWSRVSEWASHEFADALRTTDWTRVPTASIQSVTPHAIGASVADAVVVYDSGLRVGVRAERRPEGWRITTAIPMRTLY